MNPRKRIVPGRKKLPATRPRKRPRPTARPRSAGPAALAGITVLDLSTVGPAARCTRILADYGARVIKVGAPPRRAGVQVEPAFYAYSARRGFQQVRIDLKEREGRDAFLKLVRIADVIVESYRPGVAARLGIGWEAARRANPRVIYCATSGYGQSGPSASWAGHDLNYLALGGYLHTSGRGARGKPPLPGATIADSAAGGMHAAIAILAALQRRARTRKGELLDVSVTEGVLSLMSLYIDEFLATGEKPGPGHDVLTGRYAFYDTFECRDGKWLAVAAIEGHFFRNLCSALQCERFADKQYDDAAQPQMRAAFAAAFAGRDRDDWVEALAPNDTCIAPVYSIEELVKDRHLLARGAFSEAEHPNRGRFEQVGPVLAGMDREGEPFEARDASRSDSAELLAEAGLSPARIEALRDLGIIA
jgi:alpha-methylacyl-CoA racemase